MDTKASASDSAKSAGAASAPPVRRRRWLRVIGILIVLFILFVAGVVSYAGTVHAFKHVILPAVAGRAPGKLHADSGWISFAGRLKMENAIYTANDDSVSFQAASLDARVAPFSFLSGRLPHIYEVKLKDPVVVVRETEAGKKEKEKEKKSEPPKEKKPKGERVIPVEIDSITIENLTFDYLKGEEKQIGLHGANFALSNLLPGQQAKLNLKTNYAIAPDDPARKRTGDFSYDFTVSQDASGTKISWDGTGAVKIREGITDAKGGEAALQQFDSSQKGEYVSDASLDASSSIAAKRADKTVGAVSVTILWKKPDSGPDQLESTVKIDSLTREFLNPILAVFGPAQFETAALNGSLQIKSVGDNYNFDSTLTGKNLSVRAEKGKEPTPALNIESAQSGSLKQDQSSITIAQAQLRVDESAQPRITAALSNPMTIKLKSDEKAGAAVKQAAPEAHFKLHLSEISVANLKTWLALADSKALDSIEKGTAQGDFDVAVLKDGDQLNLSGKLALDGVVAKQDADKKSIGSLAIQNEFNAKMENAKRVELSPLTSKITLDGKALTDASVSGVYDTETGSANLKLTLASANLSETLDRLGISVSGGDVTMSGGKLAVETTAARADKKQSMKLIGNVNLQTFKLASKPAGLPERSLERSAVLQYNVAFDPDMSLAQFESLTLNLLEPGGAVAGKVTASGHWPLKQPEKGKKGQAGMAQLTVRELNGEPWVKLMGWAEGRDLGKLPIEADETITISDAGDQMKFEGEERIGPVKLDSGDNAPEQVSMALQSKFEKIDKDVKNIVVDWKSTREKGAPDHLHMEGSAKLGDRPIVNLTGQLDSLNADIYTAQFMEPQKKGDAKDEKKSAESKQAEKAKDEKAAAAAKSEPQQEVKEALPLDLQAAFKVVKLHWRDIQVEQGSIKATGNAQTMQAVLESTKLNGGTIQGKFDMSVRAGQRQMAWSANGKGIPTGPITASLVSDPKRKTEGTATFNTKGTGAGTGDQLKRSLDGNVVFDLADGKFGEIKILKYIADVTGIAAFNQMIFKTFHSDIVLGGGNATLKDVNVTGPYAQLIASGKVGLDGNLDVWVNPRVGPTLADKIPQTQYVTALLSKAGDMTIIPIAVTVTGTTDDPKYGAKPTNPELVKDATQMVKDAVKGIDTGKGVDSLKDSVGGLLKGLKGDNNTSSKKKK